jgi:hypothetical protein
MHGGVVVRHILARFNAGECDKQGLKTWRIQLEGSSSLALVHALHQREKFRLEPHGGALRLCGGDLAI